MGYHRGVLRVPDETKDSGIGGEFPQFDPTKYRPALEGWIK